MTAYSRFIQILESKNLRRGRVRWVCPAHEDCNPSLSVSEGREGRVLIKCHAGCELTAILAAIGLEMSDLFEPQNDCKRSAVTKTYDYRSEHGELLFQVCREEPKKFWQRRPDGQDRWINDLRGVERVPYRLPELLANPDAVVFVVEGEKDADRLASLGLVATTNPMGAGKWHRSYNRFFKGREVVSLPDNDLPGREHAEKVARSLYAVTRTIKILELEGLPEKGDISDWLDAGHEVDELVDLVDSTAFYEPPKEQHRRTDKPDLKVIDIDTARRRKATPKGDETSKGVTAARDSLANQLVELVLSEDVVLFHDERGESYASMTVTGGRRIVSLGSKDFGKWIGRLAWDRLGRTVGSEALTSTRQTLGGIARFDREQHRLHVRYAWHDGAIWIDMDGRRAIRIRPGQWEIVEQPPILFRSFPHQLPIADPIKGGDPWQLLRFINVRSEDDQLMLLAFLIAAMIPGTPVAGLILHGVQGSAKTTLLKIIKRLIDPTMVEVRGGVRDLAEFALVAAQHRVVFYDNLTSLPDWLSDALCRLISGEGWSKRTLYSDEDSTVFQYQAVVGIAGINLVVDRPDLLDRSIIIRLDPVSRRERRHEKELWREFDEVAPSIMGGLLDALSRAMCVEPGLWPKDLPRMADFARWGAAAALGLRREPTDFLKIYQRNVGRQCEAVLDESPVAQAVLAFMEARDDWDGTPSELLSELETVAERKHLDTRATAWPKAANWLRRRLTEVIPTLQTMGIEVKTKRPSGERGIQLLKVSGDADIADMAS